MPRRRPAVLTLAIPVAFAFTIGSTARPVHAQESVAEQLFIEGKALMARGQAQKACSAFKASHDLDPTATGTLLNLALCHEQIGKPATAWAEFRQVAAESEGRRPDRVTMAREHEAKLAPLLEHLVVQVDATARVPGLVVQLDGEATLPEAVWNQPLPVDPGEHTVRASAPGKVSRVAHLVIGMRDGEARVVVQRLVDLPPEAAPTEEPVDHTRRSIGVAVAGAGVAMAVVGGIFGLDAIAKNRDSNRLCPTTVCVDEPTRASASAALSSAHEAATASNVFLAIGAVAVAGGAVLIFTSPKPIFGSRTALVTNGSSIAIVGAW